MKKKKGGKSGRQLIKIDWKTFDKLCEIQCTLAEISSFFGCSEDTIERACIRVKEMPFAAYYEIKRGKGLASLRRRQMQVAMSGNATMLIWLGKQLLNQSDKSEHTGKGGGPLVIEVVYSDKPPAHSDAENPDQS